MSSSLKFDHAVILVNDLNAAINDYRELGFNAFFGGEHAGGKTHNALIVFEDGTYLELLAPTSAELLQYVDPADFTSFLYMFVQGEGLGGYAMQSDSLKSQIERMETQGLNVKMRPPGGRARPDGQALRWQSAMIGNSMTPFFIQDETPRVLRVPNEPDQTTQANHIHGVSGVTVAVANLNEGTRLYRTITGVEAQPEAANSVLFDLGAFAIRVLEDPSRDGKGDQLIALQLRGDTTETLDKALAHGATIDIIN